MGKIQTQDSKIFKDAPCRECLIIPICRCKYFVDIKKECFKLNDFIFHGLSKRHNYYERIVSIIRIVRPIRWSTPGEAKDSNDERLVDMLDVRQDCPFHYMIEEEPVKNDRKWRYNNAIEI